MRLCKIVAHQTALCCLPDAPSLCASRLRVVPSYEDPADGALLPVLPTNGRPSCRHKKHRPCVARSLSDSGHLCLTRSAVECCGTSTLLPPPVQFVHRENLAVGLVPKCACDA